MLSARAGLVTVNYPWGSLLRTLVQPILAVCARWWVSSNPAGG